MEKRKKVVNLIKSPYAEALLSAHQYQGQSNDCAAYCIAMASNAIQDSQLDGYQVGQKMNGWVWRGLLPMLRRIPNWAATPWGIVDEFCQQGFNAHWSLFNRSQKLLTLLERGHVVMPVIGQWKPMWAHVMLLVEYQPDNKWGFVNPASNSNTTYWLKDELFIRQWRWSCNMLVDAQPKAEGSH